MDRPRLITNEVGSGPWGSVTTQRLLTQGNKARELELKDQLHKVIWQIIDNLRQLDYST